MRVKPFVINKHGRLVFPANVLGELDFSVMHTLDQFTAVIGRDFEAKAPTGTDIRKKVETGAYTDRFSLLRDLGQNLFWVNRYSMTMFDKRPTRWRDLPRRRSDVFLPVLTPWEDGEAKVAAVERAWQDCRPRGTPPPSRRSSTCSSTSTGTSATTPPSCPRDHADRGRVPRAPRTRSPRWCPSTTRTTPSSGSARSSTPTGPVPELEALQRWAMVLHNQYPWDRSRTQLRPVSRPSATTTA